MKLLVSPNPNKFDFR